MVKEPNAVWHNSGRKDCLIFIGYQYQICYDLFGLIPLDELMKQETA